MMASLVYNLSDVNCVYVLIVNYDSHTGDTTSTTVVDKVIASGEIDRRGERKMTISYVEGASTTHSLVTLGGVVGVPIPTCLPAWEEHVNKSTQSNLVGGQLGIGHKANFDWRSVIIC